MNIVNVTCGQKIKINVFVPLPHQLQFKTSDRDSFQIKERHCVCSLQLVQLEIKNERCCWICGSSLYLVLIAKLRRFKLFLHNLCREHHDPGVDRHVTVENLVQYHLEGALLLIERKLSKVHRAA